MGYFGHVESSCSNARIVCEILDPRTDRLLANNSALQQQALFFRSNVLESGMFARAASDAVAYNVLSLLSCAGLATSLQEVPFSHYIPRCDCMHQGFSFWDVHD